MANNTRKIQVLIIDEDPAMRGLITHTALNSEDMNIEIMAETDSLVYGYELVRQNRPNMVFVHVGEDIAKALEIMSRMSTYFKDVLIVASGTEVSLEILQAVMQSGAREYLQRPLQEQEIRRVFDKHKVAAMVDSQTGDQTGRVITVFSNKGGLGKTTVAVNLAIALSQTVQKPVALVDLNLQLGDITTFLDIEPKQTIVDIAKNIARVDKAYLESSLAEYSFKDASVYLLADPLNVEEGEDLTAEQINAVLTVLRASFEYVIIDTTTSFDSKTLTALDLADDILLVSIVNLPCIRSSQRLISLFDRLGYEKEKVKLIVNRFVPGEEISIEDVEDTLDHPVFWKIPNAYQVVMTSINRGIPIAQVEGSKSMEKNFLDLAHKLSGKMQRTGGGPVAIAQSRQNKSLLGGLFGKK